MKQRINTFLAYGVAGVLIVMLSTGVQAETLKAAVASNALKALTEISARFEKQTGNKVLLSAGSTSKLYTQILNGAPFDLFLAANEREPAALEQKDLIVPGSRFTYAVGRLVLYSKKITSIGIDGEAFLRSDKYHRLAIANPNTAPYGHAALEVLQSLGLSEVNTSKLVRGENIGQAFQYTVTGNVDAGFVAWSDVKQQQGSTRGSVWLIPQKFYTPLRQQAVILKRTPYTKTAQNFMAFLRSDDIRNLLETDYGYGVE